MKEEDIIRKHDSGRNPFQTPAGYFEDFTPRIMARIKAEGQQTTEQPVSIQLTVKPVRRLIRYAAAAVVAGVCIGVGTYLYQQQPNLPSPAETMANYVFDEDELDEVLDYEMLDNNQIAYYLTEAY